MNVRDDARARLELPPQLRAHFQIHLRREKQRDDGCVAEAGFKQVLIQEDDSVGDAGALRVRPAFANALRIDVHADAARAARLRRRDHDAPVAATQVEHDVGGADLREIEHSGHDVLRRRLELHVGDAQPVAGGQGCLLAAGGGGDQEAGDER